MIVVGGTYQESCRDPYFSAMLGSGMRAAACLSAVDPTIRFRSAIEPASATVAITTAAGLGHRAGAKSPARRSLTLVGGEDLGGRLFLRDAAVVASSTGPEVTTDRALERRG